MAQPLNPQRQASSMVVMPKSVVPYMSTTNSACTCFILQQFSLNVQTLMLDYTRRIQSEAPIYA